MYLEELRALIVRHGIDLLSWGRGSAKSLEHLLIEVKSGEVELFERDDKLMRHLAVLDINVFTDIGGRRYLIEDRQEFTDGRVRRRELPTSVSEKLHKGENPLEAVARALEEELGVRHFQILSSADGAVETHESPSFPGLLSEYLVYRVDVLIDPTEYKDTYQEVQSDKSTYFVWSTTETEQKGDRE